MTAPGVLGVGGFDLQPVVGTVCFYLVDRKPSVEKKARFLKASSCSGQLPGDASGRIYAGRRLGSDIVENTKDFFFFVSSSGQAGRSRGTVAESSERGVYFCCC